MRVNVISTALIVVTAALAGGCGNRIPLALDMPPNPKKDEPSPAPPAPSPGPPVAEVAPEPEPVPEPEGSPVTPWFAGTEAQKAFWGRQWADAATHYQALAAQLGDTPDKARAELLLHVSQLYSDQPEAAATGLEQVVGRIALIDDTVRLLAAEAWLRADQPDKALAQLEAIGKDFAQPARVSLLRARSLAGLDRRDAAIEAYRKHLARYEPGPSVQLEAAGVLAERGPKAHEEVAAILRQILARAPYTALAREALQRLKALPRKLRGYTTSELAVRLDALYDAHYHDATVEAAEALQKRSKKASERWCHAGYLKARALEKDKKRREAAREYDVLLATCKKAGDYVDLAYRAAKRHASTAPRKALALFASIEDVAPKHTYVDDTWVHMAAIERDRGRHEAADRLLEKAMNGSGDMQETAAWQLFWHHYEAGRLKKAAAIAAKAVKVVDAGQILHSRGRLIYWLGRTLHRLGDEDQAVAVYSRVIREYPLSWYGLLAEQRLTALEPGALEKALVAAREVEPVPPIAEAGAPLLEEPVIQRAVELLRLGLRSFARAELSRAAPRGETGDWLMAWLHHEVGDYTEAYRIARWRRPGHTRRWPAEGHEERWRIANPKPAPFQKAVEAAAKKHNLDEAVIWAVMQTESAFRPEVVSFANAVGLMQLILPTGRAMAKREGIDGTVDRQRLQQPQLNIRLGSHYLARLADRFDAHPALMAAGYNAGPGGPSKWLRRGSGQELDQFVENIPYRETRRYTKSVVTAWLRYRHLYHGGQPARVAMKLP